MQKILPYPRPEHVEKYHEWMASPYLQEMTGEAGRAAQLPPGGRNESPPPPCRVRAADPGGRIRDAADLA